MRPDAAIINPICLNRLNKLSLCLCDFPQPPRTRPDQTNRWHLTRLAKFPLNYRASDVPCGDADADADANDDSTTQRRCGAGPSVPVGFFVCVCVGSLWPPLIVASSSPFGVLNVMEIDFVFFFSSTAPQTLRSDCGALALGPFAVRTVFRLSGPADA